jgi:hypothetical protein
MRGGGRSVECQDELAVEIDPACFVRVSPVVTHGRAFDPCREGDMREGDTGVTCSLDVHRAELEDRSLPGVPTKAPATLECHCEIGCCLLRLCLDRFASR